MLSQSFVKLVDMVRVKTFSFNIDLLLNWIKSDPFDKKGFIGTSCLKVNALLIGLDKEIPKIKIQTYDCTTQIG